MEGNLYHATREGILKRHQERIAQANAERDEELSALEKLRPYWESLTAQQNGSKTDTSKQKGSEQIDTKRTANLKYATYAHSDFPNKIRAVVNEEFTADDDITQNLVYDKIILRFPDEAEDIGADNLRSRILKALKRLHKHNSLKLIGRSGNIGKALIFRKVETASGNTLNFDTLKEDELDEENNETLSEVNM